MSVPVIIAALTALALAVALAAQRLGRVRLEAEWRERLVAAGLRTEKAEQSVAEILSHVPVGIAAVERASGRVAFSNAIADAVLQGRTPASLRLESQDGEALDPADGPFSPSNRGRTMRVDIVQPDGERRHLSVGSVTVEDGDGVGEIVYSIADETDRVNAERALVNGQRLEAIGTLTRGVGHDLNNLLTPIAGGLDVALRDASLSDATRRSLERASEAVSRATTLVSRLQVFTGDARLENRRIALAPLVDGTIDLFGRKLGAAVETTVSLHATPTVDVDPRQLELAILSLMVNARDAMPEGGTFRVTLTEEDRGDGVVEPGRYARISFADDGVGMDAVTAARATEPFFTTKPVGRGSGLGLSMARGLATRSGGALVIDSAEGRGTRVDLLLPVASEREEAPATSSTEEIAQTRPLRLLVVDDEDLVRSTIAETLHALGHHVEEAASGVEAITRIQRGLEVDGVVADQVLRGMTGVQMAEVLRRDRPDLPVLVISGYVAPEDLPREYPTLAKPFRRTDLAREVERMTRVEA